MDSPEKAANFCKDLEKLISIFKGGDPNPLSGRQERQLHAWKALLEEASPVKKSRTRTHIRMKARKIALKVKKVAGSETLLLFMIRYSISGLPKITYHEFYQGLQEWSYRTNFPELLEEKASQIWDEPSPASHTLSNQQVALQHEPHLQQHLDAGDTSSAKTSPDAPIPLTSCIYITWRHGKTRNWHWM